MKIKIIILDFNRTLFNPEKNCEIEGCTEILNFFRTRNVKICIVSRKEKGNETISTLILKKNFVSLVDKIYFEETDSKLNSYKRIQSDFNVPSYSILVIGDYLEKDIEPAVILGYKTICFRNGKFANSNSEVRPNFEVKKLLDIVSIFEKLNN